MVSKEECLKALDNVKNGYRFMLPNRENVFDVGVSILNQLIEEHFDNPPLKFDELKGGMIIWDNATKEWKELFDWWDDWIRYYKFGCQFSDRLERLDNRYYRKQVEDEN